MTLPFHHLLDTIPPERRERIEINTNLLRREMALRELRQAFKLTQEDLANSLHLNQAAVSKFEHQSDIFCAKFFL